MKQNDQLSIPLISFVALLLILYFIFRSVFLFSYHYDTLERILATIYLISESFLIFHGVGYFGTLLFVKKESKYQKKVAELTDFPSVAILVPSRHEPKEMLEETYHSLKQLDYPNKHIYFLDDSSEEKYLKEAEEICEKYHVKLFRRKERHGAKAGIINDCLKNLREKYVVVFDADQKPLQDFLKKLIPYLEGYPKLAFVQTPQFYSNLKASRITQAANMQQAVFYEYICEGKSNSHSMICCGTNVIFRRQALLEVGGLDEETVTEDFATSLKLHQRGWDSIYYNHVGTFGMGPEDITAYLKQQNRWALGNVAVLKKVFKELIKNPKSLSAKQWFEYIITGSYYLIGWAYTALILAPIIYVLFNVPSFFLNGWIYVLTFFPYMILSFNLYIRGMRRRNYSFKQIATGYLLFFICIPIYMRASFLALIGKKGTFQITNKKSSGRISYYFYWHQLLMWLLHLVAISWALNRVYYENNISVMINLFWISYHILCLSSVFYFNELDQISINLFRKIKRQAKFSYKLIDPQAQEINMQRFDIRDCFQITLPQPLEIGAKILCGVSLKGNKSVVFNGQVVLVSLKKFCGYQTGINIILTSEHDKLQFQKEYLR